MDSDRGEETAVGLLVACCLAALAGAVDACGLSVLHDLYVSFMSGNTTSLGAALAGGDRTRAVLIAGVIAAFVAGAAAGTVLAQGAGRHRLPAVLAAVAAVLAVPGLVPHGMLPALPFAMGMLNAAMQQAGPVSVSITYVTGTLVKLGRGLGLALLGKAGGKEWFLQALPWAGLLAGATAATFGLAAFGRLTFLALPFVALLLCLVTLDVRTGGK